MFSKSLRSSLSLVCVHGPRIGPGLSLVCFHGPLIGPGLSFVCFHGPLIGPGLSFDLYLSKVDLKDFDILVNHF